MNTIAIDCGASFLKGALFVDGKIERITQYQTPEAHKTIDVFAVRQIPQLVQAVRSMILELAQGEKEIRLCISNEMHGFLLCDSNGEPYTDYISWQAEFGKHSVDGEKPLFCLAKEPSLQNEIRRTGMPLRAGLPSCNLLYLKKTGYLDIREKKIYFYTLGDYLLLALSGKTSCCHPTNAAATGLYDLEANAWNRKLIDYVSNDNVIFPEVGLTETEFQLDGIRIYALPAVGDQQAALLGAGIEKDDLSFNLGTGAQVSRVTSTLEFSSNYQTRPFFGGSYLHTIPFLPAGRALNVYFRFVKSVLDQYGVRMDAEDIYAGLLNAEKAGEDTDILCDLGFFENAASENTQGAVTHIDEDAFTIGNLMRSVLSQMSANFLVAADKLVHNPKDIRRIVFSGGIARRIESVRDRIQEHYPSVCSTVVKEETLVGLYIYGNLLTGPDSRL